MNYLLKNFIIGAVIALVFAISAECYDKKKDYNVLKYSIYSVGVTQLIKVPPYTLYQLSWRHMNVYGTDVYGKFRFYGEYQKPNGKWQKFSSKELSDYTKNHIEKVAKQ